MKTYTAHTAPDRAPVLVREGFSVGAFILGPFWLAARGAWTMAGLVLAVDVAVAVLAPGWAMVVAAFCAGLFGPDLLRISLGWGGYGVAHVIAASTEDGALSRLLTRRPDLIAAAVK